MHSATTVPSTHVGAVRRLMALTLAAMLALVAGPALATLAAPTAQAQARQVTATAASVPLLPGETTWSGVPSFDFGSNDGVNWDTQNNMDVAPESNVIQPALKAGHLSIIRAWFFQNSLVDGHALSDAEQLQKLAAVQNSGAVCFANFPTENSVAYDLHLLSVLDGGGHIACPYVEVMNEPDIEGVDSTAYLAFWNSFVPQARAAYPGVLFGGPADYDNQGNECTYYPDGTSACFLQKVMMGMKASGNLPDFVTYHWYPCWQNTASQCLALAGSFASAAQQVIGWDTSIFGHQIPVINSEWNADPGGTTYMQDRNWDAQFVSAALKNMETSGLSGALEMDISEYGDYGDLDLFDIYHGGQPFATWTNGFAPVIAAAYNGGTPPPPPPPPAPVIANFTPTSGPVGTSVSVTGSGFTGATSVTLNGQAVASFTVSSDTSLTLTVPSGATSGPIGVTTPAGTATSTNSFTVTVNPPPPPPPTISGFTPTSGPVGTVVTISGTNFTGATAVTFNGTSAPFTVSSDASVATMVPAGATSGNVQVTTPNGVATSTASFLVTTPPPPPPPGSLALVQSNSQFVDYSGVNESYAKYAQPVSSGDLLVAEVAVVGGNPMLITKVEDDLGNTWHLAATGVNGDNSLVAIYYTVAKNGGADEVDAYLAFGPGASSQFAQTIMTVSEYHGAGSLVGGHAHGSTGQKHTSNSVTATAAGDLVVGAYADAGYDTAISMSDGKAQLGACQQSTEAAEGDQSYGYTTGAGSVSVAYHTARYAYAEVAVAVFSAA